ncbi:MAG TPA: 2-dehydropantoate 2-reductase [bacterium]|nr:MAG: 2-dehydropantoate 2-reductase [bacterium ADurb.Bin236]HPI77441.1 2-dehydropantoate 2-reductase [bacterium]
MKIAVIGPGSMGCLFAALLAEGGNDVVLVDYKPERAAMISESGITIEDGGRERTARVAASADPDSVSDRDGVIFMVKAGSTRAAAERLAPAAAPGAWAMTMQNGLGNAELLAGLFGAERVLAGTTAQGANPVGAARIRRAGRGDTFVGEFSGQATSRAERIAAMLSGAGIPAEVAPGGVSALLWKKAVINAGINPLTAVLRVRNGELLERLSALSTMRAAAAEAAAAARSAGVDISDADAVELVETVARRTAANISSMHQDVAAGRPTEIDFICGAIAAQADKHSIPVPVNKTLLNLIKAMSEGGLQD